MMCSGYHLCTGKLSDTFLIWFNFQHFVLRVFNVMKYHLWEFLQSEAFCWHHFPGDIFFITLLSFTLVTSSFLLYLCRGSIWISLLAWSVITSSLHFHPRWPVPFQWLIFVNCRVGLSLETRRQHSYMLSCLCTNWDVQWPVTSRFCKKWHHWSLSVMFIRDVCSVLWLSS